ncbi:hypothetical protein HUU39_16200 [candidate division KSB1 bacterium]|nr:hypothetical protein [bacterium]NUM66782.1 hypothetical protein [candidate division KSB1 bacterium]
MEREQRVNVVNTSKAAPAQRRSRSHGRVVGYFLHILWEHPALIIPMFFAIATVIGFYYQITFYDLFRVNIVNFSRPEDFFFGWMQHRPAIYAVFGSTLAMIGFFWGSEWGRRFVCQGLTRSMILNRLGVASIALVIVLVVILLFDLTLPRAVTSILNKQLLIYGTNTTCTIIIGFMLHPFLSLIPIEPNKREHSKKIRRRILYSSTLIVMFFFFLMLRGQLQSIAADQINQSKSKDIDYLVYIKSDQGMNPEPLTLRFMGSTSAYKLFYRKQDNSFVAIPQEHIALIMTKYGY